jgi:hypothetical protein
MRSLRSDKSGIIVVLVVGVTLIIITAMLWIISMYPASSIWDAIDPMMPRQGRGVMDMLHNVSGWMLIILVVGTIFWMAAHAFRRDPIEVQAY